MSAVPTVIQAGKRREDIYANRGNAAIEWPRLCEETSRLTVKKMLAV